MKLRNTYGCNRRYIMSPQFPEKPASNKLNLALDLRIVVVALLVVIVAMLALWRPWVSKATTDRTVQVTGEATVKAKPDEFLFYPNYEVKNTDKTAALNEVSQKSSDITKKLKDLGVADKDIKTSSSGYDYPVYYGNGDTPTYTLQFTITTHDVTLTQKVQDYLVTTSPTGTVSPQAQFSDAKRKQLESQARTNAAKDARTKADQLGKNVGFKITKVKTITDGDGFGGGIRPLYSADKAMSANSTDSASPSLTVQPGENDLSYSVTVDYYIK
jgi:uncharacterized protein